MENIIAVAVELENGKRRYFLTWGRIQSPTNVSQIEDLILKHSRNFNLDGKLIKAHLCSSLQEAKNEPYFYECFFDMCQKIIPFGENTYEQWRQEMNSKIQAGKEIYYLGENLS